MQYITDEDETEEKQERYIGPLKESDRRRKVLAYLKKKYNKAFSKKFCYSCR